MPDFHSLTIESCLKELNTSANGLESEEAEKRLKKYGPNKLEEEKPLGWLTILWSQFKSPLIYVLLAAAIISFFLSEYVDAGVIAGAVILNTIIGFFQENKANRALSKLRKMIEHRALVLRGGKEITVDSSQLTVGDIIILQAGNRVSADGRIIEASNLQINEANLTGESIPSSKSVDKLPKGAALADQENMTFGSTIVVRGSGRAVVTAIGAKSEIGKIASLVKATPEEKTPLQLRLLRLSKFLGLAVVFICLLVIGLGVWQGRDFFEMFIVAVAIAVAAIPEGLAVAVTVILVLGMQRILKQKALTRKLVAAETLGSTTVICTDKTGTLTEGIMQVSNIVIGEREFELKTLGSEQDSREAKIVSLALQIGMMCNNAFVESPSEKLGEEKIIGAPTEVALLSAARQSGLDRDKLLKIEPKIDELPFDSEKKFMITLHKGKDGNYILCEKGAPEKLLEKSEGFYNRGERRKLTKEEKEKLTRVYEKLTSSGLRVLGVAMRQLKNLDWEKESAEKDWNLIDQNLTFVGFIALKDPLRPEAKETIKVCRQAGIRPVIITGDHGLTARAIAEEIGIKVKSEDIITGEVLEKMDDKKLEELVKKIDIYARVSPHHKLRIIKALQARGEVVAMTGDGINDSPALKAADIGVALGTGTDIAKETSDIVLLDNNFKTIVSAVLEGRIIFSNIRKVITYLISDSFSEVILIAGSIIAGAPLAVLPAQILWINIVNDGLPDFSLAFEKGDDGILSEKPIKKEENIVNKEMKIIIFAAGLIRDFFVLGIFYYLLKHSFDIDYVRTVIFAAIGVDSLMYVFSLRSLKRPIWRLNPFSNFYLVGAVFFSLVLLLAAIYWPPLQTILSTVPLGLNSWLLVASTGFLTILMIEMIKHYFVGKTAKQKSPAQF
ncbi:MAG: cation-translocating P-type ATPase [Patescibacteria group bacterium]|nr:cation-translocating P-type ATPase [Patescibacteria group bacterium]MDD5294940.1 cation-translocating P-type ATPase [Patescibacteria group bacterium]MDD5554748.1 cation-translocating P-type ATPase [Patescibacteria group bacterium]